MALSARHACAFGWQGEGYGISEIGPLTGIMESLATAVGAGILLGAFLMGAAGFLAGLPSRILEARTLTDGYVGGAIALMVVLVDVVIRYFG